MANAGASIEAVLTLNATGFQSGIDKSLEALNKFKNSSQSVRALNDAITQLESNLQNLSNISKTNLNTFSKLSTAINKMANGLKILQSDSINVEEAINTMNSIFKAFQGTLSSVTVNLERVAVTEREVATATRTSLEAQLQAVATLNRNRDAVMGLITGNNQLANSERSVANASTQESASIQKTGASMTQATARTNQLTNANNRLKSAMSSLKMMGTLVGSMLAYNFAHKLLVATGETIHAKSEMEGYFKMLNFGQSDIDHFNKALDNTVQQFQRVNKYSLGETISSIGVEFNLTTQEMEKAMKVTSMITSEYLRAGRNANEASLAVKDVLQGQFQRLSRETGVKGEQLKEAGWSGDTTDVLGLMEALEKVGESRNWDVFAEKANSLNDILTITQNRFGEWSADMVYNVQPAIVGVFNMIMGTAQKLAGTLEGLWKWLSGDGIESQIAKWTLLGSAIATVVGAFISYRTGAGLVQIAQMGLSSTITSTILGLNAETVATYGSLTAIRSKILGLDAEKVATLSTKDAILSKVLGLDAELVAQTSLKQGIIDNAFAQELQTMKLRGATAEELMNTLALYENQLAQKSTIGLLSAQALGLNMTTYATHGFTVALLEAKTGMEASRIASMGLAKKIALLGASFVVPTAIVGAFAIALGTMALQIHQSAQQMADFNNILQNGESIVKDNRDLVQTYTNKQAELEKQLAETKKGTVEYHEIQEKLRATNRDITVSNENLKNSYKALQVAVSSKAHYEERLTDMGIEHQHKLAEAYMNAGYSSVEAYEMANDYLNQANNGAEQLRITLQKVAQLQYKGEQNATDLANYFEETGVDKDEGKKYLTEAERLNAQAQKGLEKAMTDDSFMGRMDGWFNYYESQVEIWINNIRSKVAGGDWGAIFNDIWKGIAHGFADLPILKDFWGWVYDQIGANKYAGQGWDAFGNIFDDMVSGLEQYILNFFSNSLSGTLFENLKSTIETLASDFDLFGTIMDAFFSPVSAENGEGHLPVQEEMYQVLIQPIVDFMNGFMSDPMAYLGNALGNFGGIGGLFHVLFPSDGGASILDWANNNIVQPLGNALYNGISSIPILGYILEMLGLIPQANSDSQDKGSQLARAFQNALENIIASIPILSDILRVLGVIPQANPDANSKGHDVGQNIKDGFKNGLTGIVDIIKNELQHIIDAIGEKIEQAKNKANELGNAIVNGVRNAIDPGSPGIIAREIIGNEFGTFIPQKISDGMETAYATAQGYGQRIVDGISSVNLNSFGTLADTYESDAQVITTTSQMIGMDTATAFNDMSMAVNTTTGQMSTNVIGTYTDIGTKQGNLLTDMKTKNTTAYNDMYQKSNQSLLQMRDSTSNITNQMTQAWHHMKDQIVATANQLKTESTNHFNQLSNTIGSFYRKIQNPSSWGSAGASNLRQGVRKPSVGRRVGKAIGGYAGGSSTGYRGSSTMSISQLKKKICPNGDCGNLFDGYSATERVDVDTFLMSVLGEHGFGWNGWNSTHYKYIKDKSDQWDMKSPVINLKGGIPTNSTFKVGDFENGAPKISFDSFRGMAESIFSAIPYRFYYDSSWKGSWLGALQAGACNCWDGAHALLAFANTCGFSGSIAHGSWNGTPHVWAVIEGHKMDTTGWQQRGTWTPSASAGAPIVRTATHNPSMSNNNGMPPVEVHIHGNVYGVDDLNSQIEEGIDKGLQKHFNKSYAVGL